MTITELLNSTHQFYAAHHGLVLISSAPSLFCGLVVGATLLAHQYFKTATATAGVMIALLVGRGAALPLLGQDFDFLALGILLGMFVYSLVISHKHSKRSYF